MTTGIACGENGCRMLTQAEAEAILESVQQAKRERNERIPDETTALRAMMDAWIRLKDFGWRDATYAPADNSPLRLIEVGSTGIHNGYRDEERRFWIDDGDTWPSRPILFKPKETFVAPPSEPPAVVENET